MKPTIAELAATVRDRLSGKHGRYWSRGKEHVFGEKPNLDFLDEIYFELKSQGIDAYQPIEEQTNEYYK